MGGRRSGRPRVYPARRRRANRKQLELAKGLTSEPNLIPVDERGSGPTPTERAERAETLQRVRSERGVSAFWTEHVTNATVSATDRIIVLSLLSRKRAVG